MRWTIHDKIEITDQYGTNKRITWPIDVFRTRLGITKDTFELDMWMCNLLLDDLIELGYEPKHIKGGGI